MIQTVVKRDGRVVGFNEEKIIAAIRRAMLHTAQGEDMELASTIADRVAYRGAEQMTVEEIQDNVELMIPNDSATKQPLWDVVPAYSKIASEKKPLSDVVTFLSPR